MKNKMFILGFLIVLMLPAAFADCSDYEVSLTYSSVEENYQTFSGIRLKDPACVNRGRRSMDCWGDSSEVTLKKPLKLVYKDKGVTDTIELENHVAMYDWIPMSARRPGVTKISVEFDDGCTKDLKFNLKGRKRFFSFKRWSGWLRFQ